MGMDNSVQKEMPRYKSHKTVHALQINKIEMLLEEDKYVIFPQDLEYSSFAVEADVFSRYVPEPGDYYVVYEDGYASVSPKNVFEDGYSRIGNGEGE
jgi:hypothetical protein